MFLRNYYYALAAFQADSETPDATKYSGLKNIDGGVPTYFNGLKYPARFAYNAGSTYYATIYYLRTSITGYGGAIIGTGDTPPTIDDYCLSGDMITTFSVDARNVAISHDEDGTTFTATYTITNTGEEAFTVREIGLKSTTSSSSSSSDTEYVCLFERTVLEEPLTLEPGAQGVITYTIRMNYPT